MRRGGASWARAFCLTESRRQITADGVHFEQSTCYQRYTIDIYLHFLLLAARNGIACRPRCPTASGAWWSSCCRCASPTDRFRSSATSTAAR
jgi:hypothetical protein